MPDEIHEAFDINNHVCNKLGSSRKGRKSNYNASGRCRPCTKHCCECFTKSLLREGRNPDTIKPNTKARNRTDCCCQRAAAKTGLSTKPSRHRLHEHRSYPTKTRSIFSLEYITSTQNKQHIYAVDHLANQQASPLDHEAMHEQISAPDLLTRRSFLISCSGGRARPSVVLSLKNTAVPGASGAVRPLPRASTSHLSRPPS